MSTWLILFGLIGALAAAISGFVDYLTAPMTESAKGTAAWHMTINVGVIVIFGLACAVRFLDHTSVAGYGLTAIGIMMLAISGTLGGSVAHRHLVGSSESDMRVARDAPERTATPRSTSEVSTPSGRIR